MVVDSSTVNKEFFITKKFSAAVLPFLVDKASTFIKNIFKLSLGSFNVCSSFCFFFVVLGDQVTMSAFTWSGRCSGISFLSQLRYTPLGAMINAESISPLSYSRHMLSINTLDLPVPMSMKKAK